MARSSYCLCKHYHPSKSEADYCNWLYARWKNAEIHGYVWQKLLDIGGGKTWQIDFVVFEKDGTTSYHESKGWNKSDQLALFKLSMSLKNFPERIIYWNKRRVPPLDKQGRVQLRAFAKKLNERKEWGKKILKRINADKVRKQQARRVPFRPQFQPPSKVIDIDLC